MFPISCKVTLSVLFFVLFKAEKSVSKLTLHHMGKIRFGKIRFGFWRVTFFKSFYFFYFYHLKTMGWTAGDDLPRAH